MNKISPIVHFEMDKIEVYKTNVDNESKAETILEEIRRKHPQCDPSFDLEDRDKVLRIAGSFDGVNELKIREILEKYGYQVETLP